MANLGVSDFISEPENPEKAGAFVPAPKDTDQLAELQLRREQLMNQWEGDKDPEELTGLCTELSKVEEEMGPRLLTALSVNSETDTLRTVLVGTADTLLTCPNPKELCKTIEKAIAEGKLALLHEYVRHREEVCVDLHSDDIEIVGIGQVIHPKLVRELRERTEAQIQSLVNVLENNGVIVIRPHHIDTQEQLFAQDPINVIGGTLIISNMGEVARSKEYSGLQPHFAALPKDKILTLPEAVILEGGDVIVQEGRIYVGVNGPRTNGEAVKFLAEKFPNMKIVPIELASPDSSEDVLHLDCCLGFAGKNSRGHDVIVVYEQGIKNISKEFNPDVKELLESSDVIRISRKEQENLGTNFLSIGPRKVISGTDTPEVNSALRERGIEVIELDLSLVKLWGGAFRCLCHPLYRGEKVEHALKASIAEPHAILRTPEGEEKSSRVDEIPGHTLTNSGLFGIAAAASAQVQATVASLLNTLPDPETDPDGYAAWMLMEGT